MKLDRENLQKLYRYGYALTGNEDDAYDLLHTAIEKSLDKPAESVEKSAAYVRKIMKNRHIDQYRHQQTFPHENIDDHSPVNINESTLEDIVIARHELSRIWPTLQSFDRELLFYWAVEGCTMQEIAEKVGVSRGTLLSRIHRLRKKIQSAENVQQKEVV